MKHIERFINTIERKKVDRPAGWLGLPDPRAVGGLLNHFRVNSIDELRIKIDDDIYPVELPYHSPTSDAIYAAFDFTKKGKIDNEHRTLNSPGIFENATEVEAVDNFDWPDPAKYINPDECRSVVEKAPADRALLGVIWSAHFQDAMAAFGMENALMQMLIAPEVVMEVTRRIVDFYLKANEIFYNATKGKLHAVLIGNDFGCQTGLMLSSEQIREFALWGTKLLTEQAKSYGLKVIHHSCGSIYDIIPDLIDCGVDAIHPIQALAKNMEAWRLREDYGEKVSFMGGVDAQNLLVKGNQEEVREKVKELKSIFPTGLVISPSHEAILPDIPPANIEALFEELNK
jgi:uroporphyrinogen decarboxylase